MIDIICVYTTLVERCLGTFSLGWKMSTGKWIPMIVRQNKRYSICLQMEYLIACGWEIILTASYLPLDGTFPFITHVISIHFEWGYRGTNQFTI